MEGRWMSSFAGTSKPDLTDLMIKIIRGIIHFKELMSSSLGHIPFTRLHTAICMCWYLLTYGSVNSWHWYIYIYIYLYLFIYYNIYVCVCVQFICSAIKTKTMHVNHLILVKLGETSLDFHIALLMMSWLYNPMYPLIISVIHWWKPFFHGSIHFRINHHKSLVSGWIPMCLASSTPVKCRWRCCQATTAGWWGRGSHRGSLGPVLACHALDCFSVEL